MQVQASLNLKSDYRNNKYATNKTEINSADSEYNLNQHPDRY